MKKLLVIGLALSTMAFAKGNFHNNDGDFGRKDKGQCDGTPMKEMQMTNLTEEQQKELLALKEAHKKEMAPLKIAIDEKELAVKKELLADKPNWTKIETLTKEKAEIEGKIDLARLKNGVTMKEKFGTAFGGFGKDMKGNGMKK